MTTEPIIESGMAFGPYPEGDCFYIEKCKTYRSIQTDVKMAEFLLYSARSTPRIWIVEAKSSTPKPATAPNFDNFIEEVRDKLSNALSLCIATCLKRHNTWSELPASFQKLDLETVEFGLVLVIKGHKGEWLPPLQDALRKALRPVVSTWKLSPTSVVVMNDFIAQKQGFIQ
jgi:hypothetical protein